MEMAEGTSMEAHIKTMKELTDILAAINAPIAEEDQVVTLLGSLPGGSRRIKLSPSCKKWMNSKVRLIKVKALVKPQRNNIVNC